jgi:hypothetical protein
MRAATLTAGVSCTSTAVAAPIARWLVTTSPRGSITNPDARVVGVHSVTTLSCQRVSRNEGSESATGVAADAGSVAISALSESALSESGLSDSVLSDVSSRTASRPAAMSTLCRHSYNLP